MEINPEDYLDKNNQKIQTGFYKIDDIFFIGSSQYFSIGYVCKENNKWNVNLPSSSHPLSPPNFSHFSRIDEETVEKFRNFFNKTPENKTKTLEDKTKPPILKNPTGHHRV